jgi:hypothetical protein
MAALSALPVAISSALLPSFLSLAFLPVFALAFGIWKFVKVQI